MSGYRLCRTKMADLPYYIENISTNIYSLEELCFYMQNNVYLLDETIIGEPLCDWIRDELDLKQLYSKLYRVLDQDGSIGDFILPIFKEIQYLSHEEFRQLNQTLAKLDQEPEVERQKLKADYLVENGKYVNGLKVYKTVLSEAKNEKLGAQFVSNVYHNMGCAHMHMFQYDEAISCFRTAYEGTHDQKDFEDYLRAFYMAKPKEKYLEEGTKSGASMQLLQQIEEEITKMRASVAPISASEDLGQYLEKLTKDYHNSTGL